MKFRPDIMMFTIGAILLSSFVAIGAQELIAMFPIQIVAPGFKVTMAVGLASVLTGIAAAFPTRMPRYGGAAPTSAYVRTVLPFGMVAAMSAPAALWMSYVLADLGQIDNSYPVLVQISRLVCAGLVPWCLYWSYSITMEHRRSLAWERLMHPHEHRAKKLAKAERTSL